MAVGRIKIILIAFLILGLCLLFFKKNKERFTTTPSFPSSMMYGDGTSIGLIGYFVFSSRMSYNRDNRLLLIEDDDNNNSIINTIESIKSACFSNGVLTHNLIFFFTDDSTKHSAFSITEISDLITDNWDGSARIVLPASKKLYRFIVTEVGPLFNGQVKGGVKLEYRTGYTISYLYTKSCIVTGFVNDGCIPTGTATCEPTATSKSGRLTQKRILIPAKADGSCGQSLSGTPLEMTNVECSLPRCPPVDCVPGEWTSSAPCVAPTTGPTCESNGTSRSGTRLETRTVAPPINGGNCSTENSATTRAGPCALARCPIPCAPGAWTNSGTCVPKSPTRTCESPTTSLSGLQTQTRTVAPAQFNGACSAADSATTRTIDCSLPGCPTNCEPGAWTNSGSCAINPGGQTCENSATSLSGKQLQTRTMIRETNGGSCPDSNVSKTIDCALSRCPINCVPGAWTNSGICTPVGSNCEPSETSKSGRQTQNRIITPAQFNGSCTDSNTSQTIECALDSRCPIPCEVSAWSNIGSCQQPASNILCEPTDTSQSGIQQKYHTLITPARFGGQCPITSPNTSNVQNFPCRLTTIPTCLNPFGDSSIVSLQTINNKDLPMFGTFPYNDIRITHDNIGDTAASIVDRQENFKNFTSELCV